MPIKNNDFERKNGAAEGKPKRRKANKTDADSKSDDSA